MMLACFTFSVVIVCQRCLVHSTEPQFYILPNMINSQNTSFPTFPLQPSSLSSVRPLLAGAYGDFFADDFDASRLATSIIQGGTIARYRPCKCLNYFFFLNSFHFSNLSKECFFPFRYGGLRLVERQ